MGDICRWLVEPRTIISTFHGNEFQQFLGGPRRAMTPMASSINSAGPARCNYMAFWRANKARQIMRLQHSVAALAALRPWP
jgi:hypothetical protein